jgi:parvulin-like peptidyl-prolyl isomerase
MTKKSTVGGPRARRTTAEDLERKKQYQSRAERDRMWQRRVMFATAVLIGISLIVLVGAIFYEQVWRPRQPVTTVNGVEVSTRDFQARVRFTRWLTADQIRDLYFMTGGNMDYLEQIAGQQINNLRYASLMGNQVLSEMEEEIILKQAAKELGITVDNATVDKEVNAYMASRAGLVSPDSDTPTPTLEPTVTATPLVSPTPSNTPLPTNTPTLAPTLTPVPDAATVTPGPSLTPTETPTPTLSPTPTATLEPDMIRATTAKEGDSFYKTASDTADVGRDVVREVFYYQTLRTAMLDYIGKDVPAEELQVDARHILIAFDPDQQSAETGIPPTDEQIQAAKARADEVMTALQNGEPFADLAKAASNDTGSATQGGELGWSSPDTFVPEFRDAVLNAEIGQIVGPIETQFGYHIIQVHAREVRALSPSDLNTRRSEAYQAWLDGQKAAADIQRRDDWLDRIPDEPTYDSLLGDILPLSS